MTIPYNSSRKSMIDYIKKSLILIDSDDKLLEWFTDSDINRKVIINEKDISLLVKCLINIIENDFFKNIKAY